MKDKQEDLKTKGHEMLELRQVCKKLQVENYNLEQQITKL